jgi:aminopeptidase YwaD
MSSSGQIRGGRIRPNGDTATDRRLQNGAMRAGRLLASIAVLVAGLMACTADGDDEPGRSVPPSQQSSPDEPTSAGASTPVPRRALRPVDLDATIAWRAVRHLAGDIGPREASSASYRTAAAWVEVQLTEAGFAVRRQRFRVPRGVSWGVPVDAGASVNLIATLPGFDPDEPHLIVGAHLDTVPQAPGAEDNASGVGVLLTVAEAVSNARTPFPSSSSRFGGEEPRGPTDDDHHFGSRAYVASLEDRERPAIRGMLALDRVGVGETVPVCSTGSTSDPMQRSALGAGRRAGVPTTACTNRSSDHWSFVRDGLRGARIGGTSYAGYHSPDDVPGVVDQAQLRRTARLVVSWLAPR